MWTVPGKLSWLFGWEWKFFFWVNSHLVTRIWREHDPGGLGQAAHQRRRQHRRLWLLRRSFNFSVSFQNLTLGGEYSSSLSSSSTTLVLFVNELRVLRFFEESSCFLSSSTFFSASKMSKERSSRIISPAMKEGGGESKSENSKFIFVVHFF